MRNLLPLSSVSVMDLLTLTVVLALQDPAPKILTPLYLVTLWVFNSHLKMQRLKLRCSGLSPATPQRGDITRVLSPFASLSPTPG